MVLRSELDSRFDDLTQVLNDRTAQFQNKFTQVDTVAARHEQMVSILESVMGARLTSLEEAMKESIGACRVRK